MIESPSNRSMHNTRCLKPGVILKERYKIEDVIGAGGFGITYLAWDPVLQSHVAIKEYYPSGIATRQADSSQVCVPVGSEKKEFHRGLIRFLKEAQDVARFQSEPNIVSIYDYLEENETAYMVMEYLHGCTLKQFIRLNGGSLSVDYIIHICLSVLDALQVVHNVGMIHRDISPENIFICKDLTVKLIDFGAAKQVYMDREQTISVVLKPGYAPPEQYAGRDKQGPWTDIYALGATLYYVATGEKPEESLGRVLEDQVVSVRQKNPEIPQYLSDIIMHAMQINIKDRYASAKKMRDALLHGIEKEFGNYRNIPGKKRRIWMSVVIIVLVAALLFGAIWSLYRYGHNRAGDKSEIATPNDVATELDAAATPKNAASDTDGQRQKEIATPEDAETTEKTHKDESNIMQIPENLDVLTVTSSQTEGVSLAEFEYCQDQDAGMMQGYEAEEGSPVGHNTDPYVGDCVRMTLKYLDSVQKLAPGGSQYDGAFTYYVRKRDEEDGSYKLITNKDGDWGMYDYSKWFSPGITIWTNRAYLDVPLDDCLEDGDYQISFSYGEIRDGVNVQNLFSATVNFTLHRGK